VLTWAAGRELGRREEVSLKREKKREAPIDPRPNSEKKKRVTFGSKAKGGLQGRNHLGSRVRGRKRKEKRNLSPSRSGPPMTYCCRERKVPPMRTGEAAGEKKKTGKGPFTPRTDGTAGHRRKRKTSLFFVRRSRIKRPRKKKIPSMRALPLWQGPRTKKKRKEISITEHEKRGLKL